VSEQVKDHEILWPGTDFFSVVASIEVLQKLGLSMIRLSELVDITSEPFLSNDVLTEKMVSLL